MLREELIGRRVIVARHSFHFLRHGEIVDVEGEGFTTEPFARVRFAGGDPLLSPKSVASHREDLIPLSALSIVDRCALLANVILNAPSRRIQGAALREMRRLKGKGKWLP